MFRGTFTALVTPFRNGEVDFAAFEKLIEAQVAAGITGVVAVGLFALRPADLLLVGTADGLQTR